MQETRRLGEGIIDQYGSRFIWKGYKRKHKAGVGIIISQKAKVIDILYVSERKNLYYHQWNLHVIYYELLCSN